MRFFLKATTRLPLKIVSSVLGKGDKVQFKWVARWKIWQSAEQASAFVCQRTNLSSRSQRACQISAGTAAGAPRPVGCPCSSVEPYPKPCWNSRSQPVPWPACTEGPGQIKQTKNGRNVLVLKCSKCSWLFSFACDALFALQLKTMA